MDWGLLVGVLGVPASVALTMGATSRGEFHFIRGCFIAVACGTIAAHLWWQWTNEAPLTGWRITIGGLVGAVTVAGLVIALDWVKHKETAAVPEKTSQPAPKSDPAILIECHYGAMPTTPERVYALNLFPTPRENGGGGLVEYFSLDEKKGERIWPKSKAGFPLSAYKCQLTNYDAATLFGVQVDMHLEFLETVHEGNSIHSGKVTLAREWPILITKIDPGASNTFVFYTFNMTDRFVRVTFPEFGSATQLQDNEPKRVRLIQPFRGFEMSFVPFDPTPPEAAATPAK